MAAGQNPQFTHFIHQAQVDLAYFIHDMNPLALTKGYILLTEQQNVFHQIFYVKLKLFRDNRLLKQTEFKIRDEFDVQIFNAGLIAESTFIQQLPPNTGV